MMRLKSLVPQLAGARGGLSASEVRSLGSSLLVRALGSPVVGIVSIVNTSLVIQHAGSAQFGVVSLVATFGQLLAFADLGLGAIVTTAVAQALHKRTAETLQGLHSTLSVVVRTLVMVAVLLVALSLFLSAVGGWNGLMGYEFSTGESYVVGFTVATFALSIPAGVGYRVLVGLGRNDLTVLLALAGSALSVLLTLILAWVGADWIFYALPTVFAPMMASWGGLLVGRRSLSARGLTQRGLRGAKGSVELLSGSQWMFLVNVGVPLGMQTGRIVLSHIAGGEVLATYALGAQLYSMVWLIITTTGAALWPIFVTRRGDLAATVTLWRRISVAFLMLGVLGGAGLYLLGPFVASLVSHRSIDLPASVVGAFCALLVAQCLHLPTGMLLTTPTELRFQAACVIGMGVLSFALAWPFAIWLGAAGVPLSGAVAVLLAQVVPDRLFTARMLRARPVGG